MSQAGALGSLMLAFEGTALPADVAARLASAPSAGITLFRFANVASPGQVRELTDAIRRASAAPPLIGADQEGGQFLGLGEGTTPFAGNMALGAVGDAGLAERVGRAIGLECRALGVNLAYAPVCDLASNPANPAIGIRSFGDDPSAVATLVAATVRGLQSAGVAAGLKHFPGIGDVADDSHHSLPALDAGVDELAARELVPFRAGIGAGARVVMSAHLALPRLTGEADLPSTLSRRVMTELLRDELGFEGVSITDALDMRALAQGPNLVIDVLAALAAGVDLLMTAPDAEARARIESGLAHAAARGLIDRDGAATSAGARRDAPRLAGGLRRSGPRRRGLPGPPRARRRARRAVDDARPRRRRRAAAAPSARWPPPRDPAAANRPDAGRHDVRGRSRPGGGAPRAVRRRRRDRRRPRAVGRRDRRRPRGRGRPRRGRDRDERRLPRARRRPGSSTRCCPRAGRR